MAHSRYVLKHSWPEQARCSGECLSRARKKNHVTYIVARNRPFASGKRWKIFTRIALQNANVGGLQPSVSELHRNILNDIHFSSTPQFWLSSSERNGGDDPLFFPPISVPTGTHSHTHLQPGGKWQGNNCRTQSKARDTEGSPSNSIKGHFFMYRENCANNVSQGRFL